MQYRCQGSDAHPTVFERLQARRNFAPHARNAHARVASTMLRGVGENKDGVFGIKWGLGIWRRRRFYDDIIRGKRGRFFI